MTASNKSLRLTASALAPWLIAATLPAQAGNLTGVILDDLREPVAGVQILLEQIGGESSPWTTVTGPDGRFSVSDPLLFGNIRVTPTKPGIQFLPSIRELFFQVDASTEFGVFVDLKPVVGWLFWSGPGGLVADTGSAANIDHATIRASGTNQMTIASDAFHGPGMRAIAFDWRDGAGRLAWQTTFGTSHRSRLKFSCSLMGTDDGPAASGPRDFQLQYSLDGLGWTNVAGGALQAGRGARNFNSLNRAILPPVLDDQPSVHLRLLMTSNTSVNGGPVTDGQSHLDDVLVEGIIGDAPLTISLERDMVTVTTEAHSAPELESSFDLIHWTPTQAPVEVRASHFILQRDSRTGPFEFFRKAQAPSGNN
jgi:hypothetical protein